MPVLYERASSYDPERSEGGLQYKAETTAGSSSTLVFSTQKSRAGSRTALLVMIGFLVAAAMLCCGHHAYLFYYLRGKDVQQFIIPQSWNRDLSGTAIPVVVQALLKASVGVALTQHIWLYVQANRVTLRELDTVFSLPDFSAKWRFLKRSMIKIVALVSVIQVLSLVSILAPNALTVVPAVPLLANLSVSVPVLDRIPLTTSSYFMQDGCRESTSDGSCLPNLYYMNPSSSFQRLARGVLDDGIIFPWSPPIGCGRACNYTLTYWAPALRCTDIPQSSMTVFNTEFTNSVGATEMASSNAAQASPSAYYLEGAYVFNATTSFGTGWTPWYPTQGPQSYEVVSVFLSRPFEQPFSLDIVYASNDFILPFTSGHPINYELTGHHCAFYNASYTASVHFSNSSQTIIPRITMYDNDPLTAQSAGQAVLHASTVDEVDPGLRSIFAAMGLADAFSQYIFGTIALTNATANREPSLATSYTNVLNSIFTKNTSFNANNESYAAELNTLRLSLISPNYDNLGRLLEDAFTNLTLSLMSDRANLGLTMSVLASRALDTNIYEYDPKRLGIVYGIALLITFLSTWRWVRPLKINGAMEREFSSIAASVRGRELDVLLGEPEDPLLGHAQNVKLRYYTSRPAHGWKAGFAIEEGA